LQADHSFLWTCCGVGVTLYNYVLFFWKIRFCLGSWHHWHCCCWDLWSVCISLSKYIFSVWFVNVV